MISTLARGVRLAACGGILAGGAVAAGALLEARSPIQRALEVPVDGGGLRVLHISDIHMWRGSAWEVEWLRSLAELEPDLVVATGDNLCEPEGFPLLKRALAPLRGIPGVFVFGSNDYYSGVFSTPLRYIPQALRKISRAAGYTIGTPRAPRRVRTVPDLPHREMHAFLSGRLGWTDVRNGGVVLDITPRYGLPVTHTASRESVRVAFAGLDDPHINYDAEVSTPAGWEGADLRVGVVHAPYARALDDLVAAGSDIVFAGHTHGGQICLPVARALVNNCDAPLWASGGLVRWQVGTVAEPRPNAYHGIVRPLRDHSGSTGREAWLHVSRGLGTSKYAPFRLFCRPETTVLSLADRDEPRV